MKHGKREDSDARVAKSFPIRVATIAVALAAAIFFTGCATASMPVTAGNFYLVGWGWLRDPGTAAPRQTPPSASRRAASQVTASIT